MSPSWCITGQWSFPWRSSQLVSIPTAFSVNQSLGRYWQNETITTANNNNTRVLTHNSAIRIHRKHGTEITSYFRCIQSVSCQVVGVHQGQKVEGGEGYTIHTQVKSRSGNFSCILLITDTTASKGGMSALGRGGELKIRWAVGTDKISGTQHPNPPPHQFALFTTDCPRDDVQTNIVGQCVSLRIIPWLATFPQLSEGSYLTIPEAKELATNRAEWHQYVAQHIYLDAGWTKVLRQSKTRVD